MNITGKVEVLKDKNDCPYIALAVDEQSISLYLEFIKKNIPQEFIDLQQNRDSGHHHITLFNAAQYGNIERHYPEKLEVLNAKIFEINAGYKCWGIGTATSEKINEATNTTDTTFFIVVTNDEILNLRSELLPKWKFSHLHCTLAFSAKDVHEPKTDKSPTSLIYLNDAIVKTSKSLKI